MQHSSILVASHNYRDALIQQLQDMALETENKQLDHTTITKAIEYIFDNPGVGFYMIYCIQDHIFGSLLMTREYNIYTGVTLWFQSVFVKKEKRQKGIFKQMFKEFEKYCKKENAPMKLYVEVENKVAIKVYEKLGMIRTNEIIFEDDYIFHPVKILNLGMDCHTRIANNKLEIYELLKKGKSIMDNDLTKQLQVESCLKNNGNPFFITQHYDDYLISFYFIEFSDWRNGYILWFYDFISSTYNNGTISLMISNLLNTLKQKKIKLQSEIKGVRIIVDKTKGDRLEQLLEVVGLKESHYYIYYKNII